MSKGEDKGKGAIGSPALPRCRDAATGRAEFQIVQTTVGGFLRKVGVLGGDGDQLGQGRALAGQRAALDISTNVIKQRMLRDVLRGGTLPPLVVSAQEATPNGWEIVDGLQRTDVLMHAHRALAGQSEGGDGLPQFVKVQFAALAEGGHVPLNVDQLLAQPLVVQVWHGLSAEELVRLFTVLNVGQQRMSPRHLLEVVHADLREVFQAWGVRIMTEEEEKGMPRRRRRKLPTGVGLPSMMHFKYESLVDALVAYALRDPQIKTRKVLEDVEAARTRVGDQLLNIGSEQCNRDLAWVCSSLNVAVNRAYADTAVWRGVLQLSDNFLIPTCAALGDARSRQGAGSDVDRFCEDAVELLGRSKQEDPLGFFSGVGNLQGALDAVTSNIGRTQRSIIFNGWSRFFTEGATSKGSPLVWSED